MGSKKGVQNISIEAAERNRETVAKRNKEVRRKLYDITIPDIVNPSRRAKGGESLEQFLAIYFRELFYLPLGNDHREQLQGAETIIKQGGRICIAAPRGDGKTTRISIAALWSLFYGLQSFVFIIGADAKKAEGILSLIRSVIETNVLIQEDFPEFCFPLCKANGSKKTATMFTVEGKNIGCDLSKQKIVFGMDKGVIQTGSILGSMRGLIHASNYSGAVMRPSLILLDDPSTSESAKSKMQNDEREQAISTTISGLSDPRKQVAIFALVTVIRRGDLASRLLDKKLHPEFQSIKHQLVYDWGKEQAEKWLEYDLIWRDYGKLEAALYFKKELQGKIKGRIGWEHKIRQGEIDAWHTARNLYLENGQSNFEAEYNNNPRMEVSAGFDLNMDDILLKSSGLKQGVCPNDSIISCGIDINLYAITAVVMASDNLGAVSIIDYLQTTGEGGKIWSEKSKLSEEQMLYSALVNTLQLLFGKNYKDENGNVVSVGLTVCDLGYKPNALIPAINFMRRQTGKNIMGCRGFSSRHYNSRNSFRKGDGWHTGTYMTTTGFILNSDIWKERIQRGFLLPTGAPGFSIALYANGNHSKYADEILGERITDVLTGEKGAIEYRWALLPGCKNDFLDASGYALAALGGQGINPIKRMKLENQIETGKEGVAEMPKPQPEKITPPIQKPRQKIFERRQRNSWMNR